MSTSPYPPIVDFQSLAPLRPMTDDEFLDLAHTWHSSPHWWEREAYAAVIGGRFLIIHGRNDDLVYLVRMWFRIPDMSFRGDAESFESGNEVLLHYFARGDDDAALHDHPWDFTSDILVGGYQEHLPPLNWTHGSKVGPAWNERVEWRFPGATITHKATDLHCVGRILPGTFSLMRTGPRHRSWGFHPTGEAWMPYETFLKRQAAKSETARLVKGVKNV